MSRTVRTVLVLVFVVAVLLAPASPADAKRRSTPDIDTSSYIVVYGNEVAGAGNDDKTDELEKGHGFKAKHRYAKVLRGFSATLSDAQVDRLRRDPDVAAVVADGKVHATGSDATADGETVPPGVRRVGAADAGGTTVREASTVDVAVVDSGVDLDHPDLNVAPTGKNCVSTTLPPDDDNGHGTHVAGTIGARNTGVGVVGVAPGTRVVPVKVLDSAGGGSWSNVICGLDWVTSTRTDGDATNDIGVANLSLGGSGNPVGTCSTTTDPLHLAVCGAAAKGVTVVVAAGNDGWDFDYAALPDVPAAYPEVLTVTAMADTDGIAGGTGPVPACTTGEADDTGAGFSNFAATAAGAAHVIAAPGVCVRSTWPGGYATSSGTSMATPHVAGLVALCIGEGTTPGPCAGLAPADVIRTMRQAAAGRPATDGFVGDLNRPWAGVTFGNLAAATAAPAAAPLPPAITIADTTVVEPASSTAARTFAVTLSAASTTPVTVDYQTVDGTAAAPADFTTASGTVTFNPGETAKTLAVSVVGDGAPEASETFTVMLDSPTGATIADGSATATIVDPTPAVRISDASVSERTTEAVTASFTVTLSSASYDQVQVSYQTATSTAVAPADFTAASGVLTFLRGERSKTITMTVAGDALDEGNEVFLVRLALVTANATLGDGSGTGTIVDDDAPPTISVANRSIIEGNSGTKTALVTVRLSAPSAKTVSVRRSTADGTARAGSDYTGLASAPLSFSPGQTSKTVAVTIRGDVTREANETFLLRLASPTNVTVVRSQATVTITNDD